MSNKPIEIGEGDCFVKVFHLLKNQKYEVRFYNTISAECIHSVLLKTNGKGILKLTSPEMNVNDNPDVAFKLKLIK
jgi:hypothetical protein